MRKHHPHRNPHKKRPRQRRRQRRQRHPQRALNNLLFHLCLHPHNQRNPDLPLRPSPRQQRLLSRMFPLSPTSSLPSLDDLTQESSHREGSQRMPLSQGLKLLNRQQKGAHLSPRRQRKVARLTKTS